MILNRKGRKTLSQFLLQYITNNKGLLGVDGYSNVKYLTEKKGAKYNFNQSSEENKTEDVKHDNGVSNNKKVYTEDEDKGYPLISVRVFNDENGNKDEETQN